MSSNRYTDRSFPEYRHRPGRTPHPTRAADGHSYGRPEIPDFLFGVDLFNAGFYWEAHEAWEGIWKTLPPKSPEALELQGLIQLAAGFLKVSVDEQSGARQLIGAAVQKLDASKPDRPLADTADLCRRLKVLLSDSTALSESNLTEFFVRPTS